MKNPGILSFWVFLLPILASAQVNFTGSNLPVFVITTPDPIPNEPKIEGHLGVIWHEDGTTNLLSDDFNHYDGEIGIEIRGASSQFFDKKSYSFETRHADLSNRNVPLLGLPEENDWVLHGPFSDKSLMRNAVIYSLAGWFMEYAPRVRFCEVVLNNDYKGVYVLTEKIKRDKNRVPISKLTPDETTGDALTGGYILKIDKTEGGANDGWVSGYPPQPDAWQETLFLYHYPKPDEIAPEQAAYIRDFVDDFELVLKSPNYADPVKGYEKFIDKQSFIDFLIINEIGRNVDGYRLSTFMYKDRDSKGGKLKMGPVWDFNLALGNANYCDGGQTHGWAFDFNSVCPEDFWIIHFWWERLLQDPAFYLAAEQRWRQLRQSILSDERIFQFIDSLKIMLSAPAGRNFQRWDILDEYIWPNNFVGGSFNSEVEYLKTWLQARLNWLDSNFHKIGRPLFEPQNYFDPKAYPNPFSETVTFEYYVRETERIEIQIFNAIGQQIAVLKDADHLNGANSLKLDTRGLANGVYFYAVWKNGKRISEGKVVKS
ncbi:MAG: T9SS C-terminal target domain-containing protein [Bacteroidetes bacterium]|nr:MAG: T9SS C-terminal target domain-containing protein [Bacteroidota bacterium]